MQDIDKSFGQPFDLEPAGASTVTSDFEIGFLRVKQRTLPKCVFMLAIGNRLSI